jgi:hypothetical protein
MQGSFSFMATRGGDTVWGFFGGWSFHVLIVHSDPSTETSNFGDLLAGFVLGTHGNSRLFPLRHCAKPPSDLIQNVNVYLIHAHIPERFSLSNLLFYLC